jgi:hypothetical protein
MWNWISLSLFFSCSFIGLIAGIPPSRAQDSSNGHPAAGADQPWSVTVYGGASSDKFITKFYRDGDLEPDGAMAGLALDRRFLDLGWGFTFEGEGQVVRSTAHGDPNTVFALGVGFRFRNFPWSDRVPTSLAIYSGPSYATSPSSAGIGSNDQPIAFQRVRYLNYVGVELAVAIPDTDDWDGVLRMFHRSGCYGLYSSAPDASTAFGLGLRARF